MYKSIEGGSKGEETQDTMTFKKGMTLDQYLTEMKTQQFKEDEKKEENLYETSGNVFKINSKKLITYEIRESDEDNYDESVEETTKQKVQVPKLSTQNFDHEDIRSKVRIIFPSTDSKEKNSLPNSRGFRVRRQSNSPLTNKKKNPTSLTPNKNLAKTQYNHKWKIREKSNNQSPILGSSTLYGQFLKGMKQKKDQKYFKKKNTRQLDYVINYEKKINFKYSKNISDIRIEGFTDRLHERKNPSKVLK